MQINKIGSGLLIVPNEIPHQDIEHVIIDWDGFSKSQHDFVYQLYR